MKYENYSSSGLCCHCMNKGFDSVFLNCSDIESQIRDSVSVVIDYNCIRYHRMPMVNLLELEVEPVGVLEVVRRAPQQFWIINKL